MIRPQIVRPEIGPHHHRNTFHPTQPKGPPMTTASITRTTQSVEERVYARDLKIGDTITVAAQNGEYTGPITAIDEYAVFAAHPVSNANRNEANERCLCIRLPLMNTYRSKNDIVVRLLDTDDGDDSESFLPDGWVSIPWCVRCGHHLDVSTGVCPAAPDGGGCEAWVGEGFTARRGHSLHVGTCSRACPVPDWAFACTCKSPKMS